MSSATAESRPTRKKAAEPVAKYVVANDTHLAVQLTDGRNVSVPLAWYPRLEAGSPSERNRWELIGNGSAIHWPDLDEDLSVEGILAGRRSGESKKSFGNWLKLHRRGERVPVRELPLPDWAK
jgi:Protein of unknown function (DUF2442)